MESWLPTLLILIIGTVAGVAIGYFIFGRASGLAGRNVADKSASKRLRRLREEAPTFFDSVKDDLTRPEFAHVREFAIVASSDITFVSEELRFVYYEDEVPNLKDLAKSLEDDGFVDNVTSGRTPIFRMREHFVEVLDTL